eukprot:scaffold18810_cov118-Isochrysis_galbana.AAC.3
MLLCRLPTPTPCIELLIFSYAARGGVSFANPSKNKAQAFQNSSSGKTRERPCANYVAHGQGQGRRALHWRRTTHISRSQRQASETGMSMKALEKSES